MDGPPSPDTTEPPPKPNKGISRRTLIKVGAVTAALAVPAISAAIALTRPSEQAEAAEEDTTPPETQVPEELLEAPKSELFSFLENHPMLVNLSTEQKKLMESYVLNQINHYKREANSQKIASIDDVLLSDLSKRVKNSGKWQDKVDKNASERGFYLDSFTRRVLPGLIFVESEGDPNKLSPKGAKGLCQLMPGIATSLAKDPKINIDLGENQVGLYDPDKNITLSLEYLDKLYKIFPDPTLAVWAYQLGETNLVDCLHAYLTESKPGEEPKTDTQIQEINRDFADIWTTATAKYISGKKINIVDLLGSEPVQKILIEGLRKAGKTVPIEDDTQYYVARILAGEFLIKTQKNFQTTAQSPS